MPSKITIKPLTVKSSFINSKINLDVNEIDIDQNKMTVTFHDKAGAARSLTKLKQNQTGATAESIDIPAVTIEKNEKQITFSGQSENFKFYVNLLKKMKLITTENEEECIQALNALSAPVAKLQN